MGKVIVVLVLTPFVMLGHLVGLFYGAVCRGVREGQQTTDALFIEVVYKVSERRRAEKLKD